jgi:hypothetical protein
MMIKAIDHILDLAGAKGPPGPPGRPVRPAAPPAGAAPQALPAAPAAGARPPRAFKAYDFAQILPAIRALMEAPADLADAADAALLDLVRSREALPLSPGSTLPHGMAPEDLVRIIAVQHLLRRDWQKYHGEIEALRDEAPTATFRRMIQADLDALRR